MSSNPYENEPGFENNATGEHTENIAHYVAKVSALRPNSVTPNPHSLLD